MAAEFSPFAAGRSEPGSSTPFVLKRVASASTPAGFQSLTSGGVGGAAPSKPAPCETGPGHDPVVTLQREGDRVTGIRITCRCGEVIDLACVY
jgi:hypothetical protein